MKFPRLQQQFSKHEHGSSHGLLESPAADGSEATAGSLIRSLTGNLKPHQFNWHFSVFVWRKTENSAAKGGNVAPTIWEKVGHLQQNRKSNKINVHNFKSHIPCIVRPRNYGHNQWRKHHENTKSSDTTYFVQNSFCLYGLAVLSVSLLAFRSKVALKKE
jgi:hypothetical protein